jgi:hypothetical protein
MMMIFKIKMLQKGMKANTTMLIHEKIFANSVFLPIPEHNSPFITSIVKINWIPYNAVHIQITVMVILALLVVHRKTLCKGNLTAMKRSTVIKTSKYMLIMVNTLDE